MADGNQAPRDSATQADIATECAHLRDFLCAKNRAYGDSAINPVRVFSKANAQEQLRVRIDDKLSRLMRGEAAGEDAELDLIGYLILLRVARRQAIRVPGAPEPAPCVYVPQPLAPELEAARAELEAEANVPHPAGFFAQMNTCRDAYIRLGLAFARLIPKQSTVLELGCGTGHQTAALARLGYDVIGFDPLAEFVEPGFEFYREDPLAPGPPIRPRDVVICTEVAEHIYEHRADRLVDVVTGAARDFVIWSAARPGQEWEGHVNLQPPEYWLQKFHARGFDFSQDLTISLRREMRDMSAQHCGALDNFCVLVRSDRAPRP